MKFQHDSYENEQNAGRAHLAMKWGYRAHNVLLIAIQLYVVLLPLPLYLKALGLVLLSLGIWINGEAAQWHARATDDHFARAEKLKDHCRRCGSLTDLGHELCTGCRMDEGLAFAFAAAGKATGSGDGKSHAEIKAAPFEHFSKGAGA